MKLPPFERFVKNSYTGTLLTLDPGETTGFSLWHNAKLVQAAQLDTHEVKSCIEWLNEWVKITKARSPDDTFYVVIEEYRVYANKAESHAQSTMHTSRLIGAFECLFGLYGISYEFRLASFAKQWATDDKLKAWDLWKVGERHARDAIRHACYFYHQKERPDNL